MEQIEKLEKRVDKIEDKVNNILEQIAGFKPILEMMNKNIEKISSSTIDKERIITLENKVESLQEEVDKRTTGQEIEEFRKIKWTILSCIITAIVTFLISTILK